MQKNQNRKGFTLIELLIVVVIIGILAAIAIPRFANTKERAYIASEKADLKNLVNIQESFFADSNKYAPKASLTGNYLWNVSKGNVIEDVQGDATGWSAKLSNPGVINNTNSKYCKIFAGSGTAADANKITGQVDGAPECAAS